MKSIIILLAGDILTLFIVTVAGFATHGELETAGLRLLSTFIPLVISWCLVAPFFGAFDMESVGDIRNLWKPAWAMFVATPLAMLLRGLWLNRPVIILFAFVISGVSAAALLAWRWLYLAARNMLRR